MRTPTLSALMRKSLETDVVHVSAAVEEDKKKQQLWGELLTSGERETEFIMLVIVFVHRTLHKVVLRVKPAGHCCGSDVIWGVWRGYGVDVWLPRLISSTLSLKFIQKNFNSWKHECFFFPHGWIVAKASWGELKSSNRKCGCSTSTTKSLKKKHPRGPACAC